LIGNTLETRFLPDDLHPLWSHHRDEIEANLILRSDYGTRTLREALEGVESVFLCFTNRVGSNLLTDFLEQAGFGVRVAEEDLNSESVLAATKMYNLAAFDEYLAYVVNQTKRNGTFFCKVGAPQLFWLANRGFLPDFFGSSKFIFVRRQDKIAQSVSLFIANSTGRYLKQASDLENEPSIKPSFDRIEIVKCLRDILNSERLFHYFFALHSISALQVWYEEFVSTPRAVISEVAQFCGQESQSWLHINGVDVSNARLQSQSSELNEIMCREMRATFSLSGADFQIS
jgi:hypothetical protein